LSVWQWKRSLRRKRENERKRVGEREGKREDSCSRFIFA
jgi:hypothetical protein